MQIVQLIVATLFIVLLIWGLALVLRRVFPSAAGIRILNAQVRGVFYLGPRERIALLTLGSRHYLFGITATQINQLAEVSAEDAEAMLSGAAQSSGFAGLLARSLRK